VFVKRIADEWYPKAKKMTLLMDNFKTHAASAFYETFELMEAKRLWDRFEFVYTPKHDSWLNISDIELHVLNGQCLNRPIAKMKRVKEEVEALQTNRNNKNSKINWQFTNKEARIKLKRLYPLLHDLLDTRCFLYFISKRDEKDAQSQIAHPDKNLAGYAV
jgi:hypothetical protein